MLSESGEKLDQPVLDVFLLGLLDYEDTLRLQRRLVYEVSGSLGQIAALLLCEHSPTITVGRLGSRSHIECDDEELVSRGISVRWVNRGGGCNLHVPGQLAAYPILPFPAGCVQIGDYLRRLERCLLAVLREFSIPAKAHSEHRGIWTPAGQIASIGVAVSRCVTYHGMTLNVTGRKDQFRLLHPEGNGALRATTMEAERQRPAPMAKVRECLVRKFVETFGIERYNLFTQHPMLAPAKRDHAYARST